MTRPQERLSPAIQCGYCGNLGRMRVGAAYSEVESHDAEQTDAGVTPPWDAGAVYETLKCPACEGVLLARYFWHSVLEPQEVEYRVIYPEQPAPPDGLPTAVKAAYDRALALRKRDPNAYGVLLGRVLELVCEDRQAKGRRLHQQLEYLAAQGEIPPKLSTVAAGLRQLRNVGAHATVGELTPAEVPILDALTRAILEYVYSASLLAARAADRYEALKSAKGARTPGRSDVGSAGS